MSRYLYKDSLGILLICFVLPASVYAANHYISSGATGFDLGSTLNKDMVATTRGSEAIGLEMFEYH